MKELKFKVRARILEQLGEQLIKNESIALLELVKNAYDADATEVNLKLQSIESINDGLIEITDNGTGMDIEIIQNVWLEPGTDYRKKQLEENILTPKYKRRPLGEKGIGRFAVHKLGKEIEIITRKENSKEVHLLFDWKNFDNFTYIDEISVKVEERIPQVFTENKTGTRIVIKDLKKSFSREVIREIYRAVNSFSNPFNPADNFIVNFDIDNKEWIKDLFSIDKIKNYALFYVEAILEGNFIKNFYYEFRPYPSMEKLQKRTVTEKEIKNLQMVTKDNKEINLSQYKIGPVGFKAYIFDRETKILRLGLSDPKGLKEFLDRNGGVKIYRDGIRVYDYGEPENDWLELDIRRVNVPAKKISNNLIVASIELHRDKSKDLIEKTNREGFIENEAYLTFKSAILYLFNIIESQRNIDKEKIRLFYGTKEKSQPLITTIQELKTVIDEKIKEEKTKTEIIRYLDRIEKEYAFISETLLKSAGAGLSLSVVIHEMEKIIAELKKIVEKEKVNERIFTLVKHLNNLIEGYSTLIRKSEKKNQDIINIIDQAVFNVEYRLNYHKIKLIDQYKSYNGNKIIKVSRSLLLNSIMNIIDNSIWWLDYYKKNSDEEKTIFINLIDKPENYLSIIIADNGNGFALPVDEITKPFVSAKPDGMGLGLHIVSEIIKAHNGLLLFPEENEIEDFNIPDEFKSGAIIIISLKRG